MAPLGDHRGQPVIWDECTRAPVRALCQLWVAVRTPWAPQSHSQCHEPLRSWRTRGLWWQLFVGLRMTFASSSCDITSIDETC